MGGDLHRVRGPWCDFNLFWPHNTDPADSTRVRVMRLGFTFGFSFETELVSYVFANSWSGWGNSG